MDGVGALGMTRENARLVKAAAAGDEAAFDQLVEAHAPRVYRLALRMLGDRQEAEDVQQETFLQAFRHLRSFRGQASFNTWLYTIAARLCLRRRAKPPSEPLPDDLPAYAAEDWESHLAAAARVQRTLAALAPPDRLLIVLRYIEGLDHTQIADVLGCSVESSRSRLSRARRLFREHYERTE